MKKTEHQNINADSISYLLEKANISLNSHQLNSLWKFHQFFREKNNELNLSRIYKFENIVRKHYIDSIIILDVLKKNHLQLPDITMDLGSGAGFPGIPLSIVMPDIRFILVEGRKQRSDFLNQVVNKIGLTNVEVINKNVRPGNPVMQVDGVITRAFESMERTIDRVQGSLKENGIMIFMKGPNCEDEIKNVHLNMGSTSRLLLDEKYTLPDSTDKRRLVVWQYEPDSESMNTENPDSNCYHVKEYPEHEVAFKSSNNLINDDSIQIDNPVPIHEITSQENEKFKLLKSLKSGRMIKKHKRTLVCGYKIVCETVEKYSDSVLSLIFPNNDDFFLKTSHGLRIHEKILNQHPFISSETAIWALSPELFKQIDILNTGPPLLLCSIPVLNEWESRMETSGCILFLPLSDPDNLGAAMRTAAAFEINRLVLLKEAANPFHVKSIRASAGAVFGVELFNGPSIFDLDTAPLPLFALDKRGNNIDEVKLPEQFGLLIGQEGSGIPDRSDIQKIAVPISENVESLNAAVALGIALYQVSRE